MPKRRKQVKKQFVEEPYDESYSINSFDLESEDEYGELFQSSLSQRSVGIQKCKKLPERKKQKFSKKQKDKSLTELTKLFYHLIERSRNKTVSICQITSQLGICKRRGYDLTNILQGLGVLSKGKKATFVWQDISQEHYECIIRLGESLYYQSKTLRTISYEVNKLKEEKEQFLRENQKYFEEAKREE